MKTLRADVATVYESIALYRWQEAKQNQSQGYQIYYNFAKSPLPLGMGCIATHLRVS